MPLPHGASAAAVAADRQGQAAYSVDPLQPAARQDSKIPKPRATCATEASPLRATVMTSRRNSAGNGLGAMLSFQRGRSLRGKESTEPGVVPGAGASTIGSGVPHPRDYGVA